MGENKMEAIDKKNKKASNKSQPSLLQVLDKPMISKIKEEEDVKKANEEQTKLESKVDKIN